jgi:hypothetical protein
MTITLKKMRAKPSILTIVRNDGSSTWSKLQRGLETHDLAHYAVESILQFDNAFYGLINKGFTVADFVLPKEQRPKEVQPEHLHENALITEHIVNLLEVEFRNSGFNANFLEDLSEILKKNALSFPKLLNSEALNQIRITYHNLVNQWLILEEGQELSIYFKPSYPESF